MEDTWAENFFGAIEKNWGWLVAILLGYLVWKNNLEMDVLALAGTAFLGWLAFKLWVHYVQQDFISGIDYVVLEIVPPREVLRSPQAMELFFTNALYHWSQKSGGESYWQGAVWFWYSLEIVSIDGQVHFYIRTPTRIRSLIETQMYAQYPQAQVKAVEDYTLGVPEITPESEWNAWGCEFKLLKNQAYPIKTYVDYGLDEDPKEEYKVDPISPTIEFFGSLQKGEQAWLQIVVRPSKQQYRTKGTLFGKHDWVDESKVFLLELLQPYVRLFKNDDGEPANKAYYPPKFLDNTVKRISEKPNKIGFDTGIRVMYVAKKEIFPMGQRTNNSRAIRLIFRQFANPDSNQLWRTNATQGDAFKSEYFSLSSKQVMILANRMLHAYREREFFHLPLRHILNDHTLGEPLWGLPLWIVKNFWLPYFHPNTFVLNVEELATLWHFPGQILKVPTLERIESKEASPPPNLPT